MCRVATVKYAALKDRLFIALKLLASVLRLFRIQELTVLPLVRLTAEVFTVNSLDLLQVAASGKQSFLTPYQMIELIPLQNLSPRRVVRDE